MNKYIYYYYSEKKRREKYSWQTNSHPRTHLTSGQSNYLLIISIDVWNSIWRHAIDTCSRDEQVNAHKVRIRSLKIKSGMSESKILELWCLEPVTTLDLTLHLHKNIEHQYWKLFLRSQHWDLMYLYKFKTHNSLDTIFSLSNKLFKSNPMLELEIECYVFYN